MAGLPAHRAGKDCDCEAKSAATPPRADAKTALVVEAGAVEQMRQASSSALGERGRIMDLISSEQTAGKKARCRICLGRVVQFCSGTWSQSSSRPTGCGQMNNSPHSLSLWTKENSHCSKYKMQRKRVAVQWTGSPQICDCQLREEQAGEQPR